MPRNWANSFKTDTKSFSRFSQDLFIICSETFNILHKMREKVQKMARNIYFCNIFTKVEIIKCSQVFQMIQSIPNLGQITISQYDFWLVCIFRNLAILCTMWTRDGHNYILLLWTNIIVLSWYCASLSMVVIIQYSCFLAYVIIIHDGLINVSYRYSFLRISTLLDLMISERAL